ncbi:MAG: hypothetical protein A2Z97_09790 [Bdellovibrionales bacterium GWB1_52_6]|nr:MAG: hypothetical protein A2Z97_09790 [Bdellovibrionales bacterium GWB1_52_6]OFZ04844.1 MAG: hypothetical protein A2X97_08680 [Bdellovibrionales bacterium GWA1_52_35]HCM38930.1 hypothetical protein [Bdellovibrionales bacterium]
MRRLAFFVVPVILSGCFLDKHEQKPSLADQVFGIYQTQCASVAKDSLTSGTIEQTRIGQIQIALSKSNEITFFGDQLTIEERLYTDSDGCKGRSSPSYFKTTVGFKEAVSSDVVAPYAELSVSDYKVELYPGGMSTSLSTQKFCDRDDWTDLLPRDVTNCIREMAKENSRDEMRWILNRNGVRLKLGFLKRGESFDASRVEWLDPAEFTKVQP